MVLDQMVLDQMVLDQTVLDQTVLHPHSYYYLVSMWLIKLPHASNVQILSVLFPSNSTRSYQGTTEQTKLYLT